MAIPRLFLMHAQSIAQCQALLQTYDGHSLMLKEQANQEL